MARPGPLAHDNRSLKPREHGAYGQLLAPLIAALLAGRPSLGAVAFALAGTSAFLSHEPWLVLSGLRGTRLQRELGANARGRLLTLVLATAVFGTVGFVISDSITRVAAVALLLMGIVTAIVSRRALVHSSFGEIWAGTVLAFLGVPVGLAGGLAPITVMAMWLAWAAAFAAGIFAIKGIIRRNKTGGFGGALFGIVGIWLLLIGEAAKAPGVAVAVMPLAAACSLVLLRAPSPRHLRAIGWTLVGMSALSTALMVFTVRLFPIS